MLKLEKKAKKIFHPQYKVLWSYFHVNKYIHVIFKKKKKKSLRKKFYSILEKEITLVNLNEHIFV